MDRDFFNFDENPFTKREPSLSRVRSISVDPRSRGGVMIERRPVKRAKCSTCDHDLSMEIFYLDGKTRKFVICDGCNAYLFELGNKIKKGGLGTIR
jgi:hypothetical protein